MLDTRDILLNATNKIVCLSVQHTADNSDCDAPRSYPIQLAQTDGQGYTVHFRQQTANITIDDCKYYNIINNYHIGFIALIYSYYY